MIFLFKTMLSVLIIVSVTELSKKDTNIGAIILALPIVSFTSYTILWFETKDTQMIADLAKNNFLYVLPVIPALPLFSWMLKQGFGFFTTLIAASAMTALLFLLFNHFKS
jgi:hypothetical protein